MDRNIFTALLIGLLFLPVVLQFNPAVQVDAHVGDLDHVVVVLDPTEDFRLAAVKLGYKIGQDYNMEELEMKAVKVFLPNGPAIDTVINEFEEQFPGIIVADNKI